MTPFAPALMYEARLPVTVREVPPSHGFEDRRSSVRLGFQTSAKSADAHLRIRRGCHVGCQFGCQFGCHGAASNLRRAGHLRCRRKRPFPTAPDSCIIGLIAFGGSLSPELDVAG